MVSKEKNKYHYGYQRAKLCRSMGIGITLYRACIGMFNRYKFSSKGISASFIYLLFLMFHILLSFLLCIHVHTCAYINKSKNYFFRLENDITLMGLIFARINFREFREFWSNSRN